MSRLVPGLLSLLAAVTSLPAQQAAAAAAVDDAASFIQRAAGSSMEAREEQLATTEMQLAARIEATVKATAELKSMLKQQITARHPRRLKLATTGTQTYREARNASRHGKVRNASRRAKASDGLLTSMANASGAGPQASPSELLHQAMEHIVAVREAIKQNLTSGGAALAAGKEKLGNWGKAAFGLDAIMASFIWLLPQTRCLPLMMVIWWGMGLATLHFDQGLSVADSMMMLAQMATTVGYGHATPKSDAMRLFHGVHGLFVGQGIDDAISSMFDIPHDIWDNCLLKKYIYNKLPFEKTTDSKLVFNLVVKTLDLVIWIIGASAYFAHDLRDHWDCETDCEDESFKGRKVLASAIYTALISMTSIGYGDLYPKGTAAKWGMPFLLEGIVVAFKRYTNALGDWNALTHNREHKEPDSDVPPFHFTHCPLPGSLRMGAKTVMAKVQGKETPRRVSLAPRQSIPGHFRGFMTDEPNRFGWLASLCDEDEKPDDPDEGAGGAAAPPDDSAVDAPLPPPMDPGVLTVDDEEPSMTSDSSDIDDFEISMMDPELQDQSLDFGNLEGGD